MAAWRSTTPGEDEELDFYGRRIQSARLDLRWQGQLDSYPADEREPDFDPSIVR
jgi:hypothetical protein